MVDVVITAANVLRVNGNTQRKNAGVAITAGDAVYVDGNGVLQLCEKDQTAVEAACAGIALNDAGVGQPVTYAVSGDVNFGAVLTAGRVYIVGAAPGAIAPVADIVATNFATVVGIAISTSVLRLALMPSGVAAG